MKRYDIEAGFAESLVIEESPNGFWVEWNDVANLEAINAELLEALESTISQMHCGCGHDYCRTCGRENELLALIVKANKRHRIGW